MVCGYILVSHIELGLRSEHLPLASEMECQDSPGTWGLAWMRGGNRNSRVGGHEHLHTWLILGVQECYPPVTLQCTWNASTGDQVGVPCCVNYSEFMDQYRNAQCCQATHPNKAVVVCSTYLPPKSFVNPIATEEKPLRKK